MPGGNVYHPIYTTGWFIWSWTSVGLTLMFLLVAQLLSLFCQIHSGQGRKGQTFKYWKSKSTQPRFQTIWDNPVDVLTFEWICWMNCWWWCCCLCCCVGACASKSSTRSFVSSVPFLDPTAQISLVWLARIRHTTPPLPPEGSATRSRMNSPAKETCEMFWKFGYDKKSAKSLLSTGDHQCIQCHVNSLTLDAPKVSCWKQGFGRRLYTGYRLVRGTWDWNKSTL